MPLSWQAPKADPDFWPSLLPAVAKYGVSTVEEVGLEALGYPVGWVTSAAHAQLVLNALRSKFQVPNV